jgi:hypothetical protein
VWKNAVAVITKGPLREAKEEEKKPVEEQKILVTNLLNHLPESAMSAALSKINFHCSREPPKRGTPIAVKPGDVGVIKMVDVVASSLDEEIMEVSIVFLFYLSHLPLSLTNLNSLTLSLSIPSTFLSSLWPISMGSRWLAL